MFQALSPPPPRVAGGTEEVPEPVRSDAATGGTTPLASLRW